MISAITMIVLLWLHGVGIRPIVDRAEALMALFLAGFIEVLIEMLLCVWMRSRRAK